MEINSGTFTSEGLHEKHAVTTCDLANRLSIYCKTWENQENQPVPPDGRSLDLPDSCWLLARTVCACVAALVIIYIARYTQ